MHYQRTGGMTYRTHSVHFHPKYKRGSSHDDYDVAIITLDAKISFNDHISPICLSKIDDNFIGETMLTAGW